MQHCLCLKVGSQVMLARKLNEELVSGTQGVVRNFVTRRQHKDAKTEDQLEALADAGPDPIPPSDFLDQQFPLVMFKTAQKKTTWVLCVPMRFEHEYICKGKAVKATRTQVPLALSWAMSIHKAQGQTLDYVCVDLRGVFTEGQTYTAISRGRTREGMQVLNFSSAAVMTDPRALEYTRSLPTAEERVKPASISEWFDPPHLARQQ